MLLREEDRRRPDRVEPEEPAGRHEREREEQDAGVAALVGRLACRVAEAERDRADDPEDHEVERIVLDVGIELRPQEQRHEPDQRQRGGEERGRNQGTCARPPTPAGPGCALRRAARRPCRS